MQTFEHSRHVGARRVTFPVPVHHRVLVDLRSHSVCHVAQHKPTRRGTERSQKSTAPLQAVAASLFRWLCRCAQGALHWHSHAGAHDNLIDFVLRSHLKAGVHEFRRDWSEYLRAGVVRNDHDCDHFGNDTSSNAALRLGEKLQLRWVVAQWTTGSRFTLVFTPADDILLVGGQTGSFLYSTFTIIGAHLTLKKNTILILITAMASLVETAFQTMFILDASRRSAATPDHIRKKPGRELVTFLLVSNLAMWAINTLEKSRAESHPLQLNFYGLWAWTIITHVSMPLGECKTSSAPPKSHSRYRFSISAIFYRFHSTVCLCDIWKRAWKMKPAYM